MKTQENLMTAFAGESQANRKYLAYAKRAEAEGFQNIGRLFKAIAEAETIHALKHLEITGKVKTSAENLAAAIEGEHHEFTAMYPEFIEAAEAEGRSDALRSFKLALEAEKVHGSLFSKVKAMVDAGSDLETEGLHLCPVCGYVGLDPAPAHCPICNARAASFIAF
ncbi:MAG: rubrerythrin family protein [Bacillota bacterium]